MRSSTTIFFPFTLFPFPGTDELLHKEGVSLFHHAPHPTRAEQNKFGKHFFGGENIHNSHFTLLLCLP